MKNFIPTGYSLFPVLKMGNYSLFEKLYKHPNMIFRIEYFEEILREDARNIDLNLFKRYVEMLNIDLQHLHPLILLYTSISNSDIFFYLVDHAIVDLNDTYEEESEKGIEKKSVIRILSENKCNFAYYFSYVDVIEKIVQYPSFFLKEDDKVYLDEIPSKIIQKLLLTY